MCCWPFVDVWLDEPPPKKPEPPAEKKEYVLVDDKLVLHPMVSQNNFPFTSPAHFQSSTSQHFHRKTNISIFFPSLDTKTCIPLRKCLSTTTTAPTIHLDSAPRQLHLNHNLNLDAPAPKPIHTPHQLPTHRLQLPTTVLKSTATSHPSPPLPKLNKSSTQS